jgi:hypothetical protein
MNAGWGQVTAADATLIGAVPMRCAEPELFLKQAFIIFAIPALLRVRIPVQCSSMMSVKIGFNTS